MRVMAEAKAKKAPAKKSAAKKAPARKGAAKKSAGATGATRKSAAKKSAPKKGGPTRLRVTQVRSLSGRPAKHRATMEALGFRWHQQTLEKEDNPSIRGMLFQVRHLVKVEEVEEGKE